MGFINLAFYPVLEGILRGEPKLLFLPKSCEYCGEEAGYDIMTADRQWQMLCPVCLVFAREIVVGGYCVRYLSL